MLKLRRFVVFRAGLCIFYEAPALKCWNKKNKTLFNV